MCGLRWEKIRFWNDALAGSWDSLVQVSDVSRMFRMMNLDWSMIWFSWQLSMDAMATAALRRCFAGQAGM